MVYHIGFVKRLMESEGSSSCQGYILVSRELFPVYENDNSADLLVSQNGVRVTTFVPQRKKESGNSYLMIVMDYY